LIHAAAKQGLSNAELRLGKILLESPWVKHDEAKATFWLNRAAKQGDINGLRKMAWIRLFSETPDIVNVNEAFKNLEPLKVADPENPEVHYILAWAYHKSNQKPLAIGALEKAIGLGKAKRWDVKEWESDLVSWKSNTSVTIEEVPQKP
jgi:TPR repeat protein